MFDEALIDFIVKVITAILAAYAAYKVVKVEKVVTKLDGDSKE